MVLRSQRARKEDGEDEEEEAKASCEGGGAIHVAAQETQAIAVARTMLEIVECGVLGPTTPGAGTEAEMREAVPHVLKQGQQSTRTHAAETIVTPKKTGQFCAFAP